MPAEWTHVDPTKHNCASASCDHKPAHWRMDAGGTASEYCYDCAQRIVVGNPIALLPCPCCGGVAKQHRSNEYDRMNGDRSFWMVRCEECNVGTRGIANPISPALQWNKRTR